MKNPSLTLCEITQLTEMFVFEKKSDNKRFVKGIEKYKHI